MLVFYGVVPPNKKLTGSTLVLILCQVLTLTFRHCANPKFSELQYLLYIWQPRLVN